MSFTQYSETNKARATRVDSSYSRFEVQRNIVSRDVPSTSVMPFSGRGLTPSTRLTPRQVLYLQRTAGNRATTQLLQNQRASLHNSPLEAQRVSRNAEPGVIQRKPKGFYNKAKGIKPSTQNVNPKQAGGDFYRLSLGVIIGDKDFLAKSTKFYIYKLINSLKPPPFRKSRQEIKEKAPTETGHSWVELTHYHEGVVQDFHSFGFMPRGGGRGEVVSPDPNSMKAPTSGYMQDFNLTHKQYSNALGRAKELQKTAKKYNLYGFNCTAFAKEIVNAAGFSFAGTRVSPGARIGPGSAFTPNRLRNALKAKAKKGKALTTTQMQTRIQGELDARRQFANQTPITLRGTLRLYDSDDSLHDIYEAGDTLARIERASSSAPGERQVQVPDGFWWVKQKELEAALGYPLSDAEYTSMQQVIAVAATLAPTTTTSQDTDPSGMDDLGGIGELTGQTPEELLENLDPQSLGIESEEQF